MVNQYGGIVQCRGYRNNVVQNGGEDKPQEIKDFEQKYQRYLDRCSLRNERSVKQHEQNYRQNISRRLSLTAG